jgi:hypothetical protein
MRLHGLLRRSTFLHVDDVRTSQETHLWAFTACYGDSFTCLYVDVHTSQETHLWASKACYGESCAFYFITQIPPVSGGGGFLPKGFTFGS